MFKIGDTVEALPGSHYAGQRGIVKVVKNDIILVAFNAGTASALGLTVHKTELKLIQPMLKIGDRVEVVTHPTLSGYLGTVTSLLTQRVGVVLDAFMANASGGLTYVDASELRPILKFFSPDFGVSTMVMSEFVPEPNKQEPKCDCGGASISSTHSHWCSLTAKEISK